MRTLFLITGILLLVFGVAAPTIIGVLDPGYIAQAQYLSELGAAGAPYAGFMNYGVFLPVGVLWTIAVFCLGMVAPKGPLLFAGAFLLLGTSVSYLGASFFHCDAGCPVDGSQSQAMHNLLGVVGYLANPFAFALLAVHFIRRGAFLAGIVTAATAIAFTAGFAGIASGDAGAYKGAWQRLADFSSLLWIFLLAALLRRQTARAS